MSVWYPQYPMARKDRVGMLVKLVSGMMSAKMTPMVPVKKHSPLSVFQSLMDAIKKRMHVRLHMCSGSSFHMLKL